MKFPFWVKIRALPFAIWFLLFKLLLRRDGVRLFFIQHAAFLYFETSRRNFYLTQNGVFTNLECVCILHSILQCFDVIHLCMYLQLVAVFTCFSSIFSLLETLFSFDNTKFQPVLFLYVHRCVLKWHSTVANKN